MIPTEKLQEPLGMAEQYKSALFRDMIYWQKKINSTGEKPQVKTLYFGGGTPLLLGSQYVIDIIEEVKNYFDITGLQELSIECNPYPYTQTLESIKHIIETYNSVFPRIRFSFGIQSLDDTILQASGRECNVAGLQHFTTDLITLKTPNTVYNYDFISFGAKETTSSSQIVWLKDLINSKQIDSFSLYTLELFPGSKRYHENKDPLIAYQAPWDHNIPFNSSEDSIVEEFSLLKSLFLQGGYQRYEISNYALPGKECLHNLTYWNMNSYIGIGLGAHGFIQNNQDSYRSEALCGRKTYIQDTSENIYKTTLSSKQDILIEEFFLGLRTTTGVANLDKYIDILHDNRKESIQRLCQENLCTFSDERLILTDFGMNVHHRICTFLMKEI